MGLGPPHFKFHSFRKSGALQAFNENIALENTKQHGNWKSEAVWANLLLELLCHPYNISETNAMLFVLGASVINSFYLT